MRECFVWNVERRIEWPAQRLFRQFHFFLAERRAVRFKSVLLVRRAIADMRTHENQRGTFPLGLRRTQRAVNRFKIVSILNRLRVPAIRFETPGTIFREGDVGRSGKRDVVVVIEANQFAELQMTSERRGLGRYSFH